MSNLLLTQLGLLDNQKVLPRNVTSVLNSLGIENG